jgi:hypothetical protein
MHLMNWVNEKILFLINQIDDLIDCSMVVKCSSDEFTCLSKNQCIPSNAVCDGIEVNNILLKSVCL